MGEQKKEWENYLNTSFLSRLRKRQSIKYKGKSFFNDYKNLSLILIYTLLNRTNSYFYTADIDIFCDLYTWINSMAHQMTFKTLLLEQMGEEGNLDILENKKLVFYINFKEFKKKCNDLLGDMIVDNWKKKRFTLYIRYWDQKKQIFFNGLKLAFNENMRDSILNNHGLFYCPFVSNNTHGNFFKYIFWPPKSIKDINTIKVSVHKKSILRFKNANPPKNIHDHYCISKKREDSKDSNLLFESFWIAG